jgi:3-oxoacyl-[acyl-carrier protein] reductase
MQIVDKVIAMRSRYLETIIWLAGRNRKVGFRRVGEHTADSDSTARFMANSVCERYHSTSLAREDQRMQISGKTVLITGAGRGLGAAMARGLAERGADVALVDLDETGLQEVAGACRALGRRVQTYSANVASEIEVVNVFERVASDFGRLDCAIANAGILRDGLLVKVKDGAVVAKLPLAQWQSVIDVNLTGVFLCGREAAERMIRLGNGGCIINISSLSRAGNFGQSNYSAAKAGVAALTVVWAKELARYGIRVNAIAPGFIKTEMVAAMKPEMLEKMAAGIPAQRLGDPSEIAATAAFILENDYCNGRVIEIDGGQRL